MRPSEAAPRREKSKTMSPCAAVAIRTCEPRARSVKSLSSVDSGGTSVTSDPSSFQRLSSHGENIVAAPRTSENPRVAPILIKTDGDVVCHTRFLRGRCYLSLNHCTFISTFNWESCPVCCQPERIAKGCVKQRLRQLLQARTALCFTHVLLTNYSTLESSIGTSRNMRERNYLPPRAMRTHQKTFRRSPRQATEAGFSLQPTLARLAFERHGESLT